MSLQTNVQGLATRVATEFKSVRTVLGLLTNLTTTNKTNLVAAINEVKAVADNAAGVTPGASINDTTASTSTVYSSTKTEAVATAAANTRVNALIAGAPAALDTLSEIADAIAANQSGIGSLVDGLNARVRHDVNNQGLTTTQQANARTNIGAAATTHTHSLASGDVTGILPISKGGTGASTATAALTALGGISAAAIGDPETNFVATFEAGLV